MSNDVQVELMLLPRGDYNNLMLDDGRLLTEVFPTQVYVLGANNFAIILEVSGELTDNMRELFPELVREQWRLDP